MTVQGMAHQHLDALLFLAIGASSPIVGWVAGWMTLGSVASTIALAAIGATVSYLVKEGLDELKKRLKK
jgi:hypothetical protein